MAGKTQDKALAGDLPRKRGAGLGSLLIIVAAFLTAFGSAQFLNRADTPSPSAPESEAGDPAYLPVSTALESQAYTPLPEILITIGSEPASRYLKLNVSVVTTKDMAKSVEQTAPRLVDAFNSYLRTIELSDFENPEFYGTLRADLAHRSEVVLGAGVSKGVLITEFLLR